MKTQNTTLDNNVEPNQFDKRTFLYRYEISCSECGGLEAVVHLLSSTCASEDDDPIRTMKYDEPDQYSKFINDIIELDINIFSSRMERVGCFRMDLGSLFSGDLGKILRYPLTQGESVWSIETEDI